MLDTLSIIYDTIHLRGSSQPNTNQGGEQMRRRTAGRTIEKGPEALAETIEEVFGFANGTKDGVLKQLMQSGDYTQWGLSNAVTAFAQDKSLNYEQATELERIGGDIIMMPANDWDKVANVA